MQDAPSLHERLVRLLAEELSPGARILDARASGTEEIVLTLAIAGPRPELVPPTQTVQTDAQSATSSQLRTAGDRKRDLHLLLLAPTPLFWLSEIARASAPPPSGITDWMRRRLIGASIARVSAGDSGRIVRFDLDSAEADSGEAAALVLDPLPNACRLLVLDRAGTVQQRYPPTIHAGPTGRGSPGERYREPAGRPVEVWLRISHESIAAPPNGTTSPENEEPWPPHSSSTSTSNGSSATLFWFYAMSRAVRPGVEAPIVFLSPMRLAPSRASALSPAPLPSWEAARQAGECSIMLARHALYRRRIRQILTREERHLGNLEQRLAHESKEAASAALHRRQAEALLANSGRIPKGAKQVAIDDPAHPGAQIEIELDPKLSFSQNAARLFKKAARYERALPQRERRAGQARSLRAHLAAWLSSPSLADPWHPLRSLLQLSPTVPHSLSATAATSARVVLDLEEPVREAKALARALEPGLEKRWSNLVRTWSEETLRLSLPIDQEGYESRRFGGRADGGGAKTLESRARGASGRQGAQTVSSASARPNQQARAEKDSDGSVRPRRFELPGGWIVLVGRSNRENDALTHHLARPDDLWFHARGVSGSHVVLRRGGRKDNPPKDIIARTASIAAYFSKARTSRMVPVVYTEKRFVRKPRKGAPGLALVQREKVIMAEPREP